MKNKKHHLTGISVNWKFHTPDSGRDTSAKALKHGCIASLIPQTFRWRILSFLSRASCGLHLSTALKCRSRITEAVTLALKIFIINIFKRQMTSSLNCQTIGESYDAELGMKNNRAWTSIVLQQYRTLHHNVDDILVDRIAVTILSHSSLYGVNTTKASKRHGRKKLACLRRRK